MCLLCCLEIARTEYNLMQVSPRRSSVIFKDKLAPSDKHPCYLLHRFYSHLQLWHHTSDNDHHVCSKSAVPSPISCLMLTAENDQGLKKKAKHTCRQSAINRIVNNIF